MRKETSDISTWQQARLWLRDGLTLLPEAFLWTGCLYLESLATGHGYGRWYMYLALGFGLLVIVARFISNVTYSRTARRDEVVACAMKTAATVGIFSAAVPCWHSFRPLAWLFFCVALTLLRLILNSWFIHYSIRHSEHGIIICDEDSAWQQKALLQNTYGLELARLEERTAQTLEGYLAEHPEAESVYCAPSSLPATELEDIAHICRKQGLTLHILPLAPCSLPQTMQSECRGTVGVLSPAKPPLQNIFNKIIKRLTDIVLSLVVLLTVFPVFAFIAFIFIKKQSKGPVLISQHVCGMNGKVFQRLTFRTRHYEAAPSFLDGVNDPGYFPFGRFLRHSRLELLPQFLCVLRGSMTIVGSETMRQDQYAEYRREARHLFAPCHCLKAGITSYQFAGQTKGSTEADVWYSSNWGFWLDVRIMLQRLVTLLRRSKAKSINYI